MICTNCQFDNPAGMKFCGNCGTPQNATCPSCQFENPPGFKFCGSCGGSLSSETSSPSGTASSSGSVAPAESISKPEISMDGHRRHLTVMFCDLVGSTALSNRLDPEDLRELVKQYQGVCEKVIARYDGHIAQFLGDGILVYFGHPVAHENDAHRAVSSGLGIIEAIHGYNDKFEESFGTTIAVRIGIHTGHVVIGGMGGEGKSQQLALGATPNIAARLEGLADSNSLIISDVTHGLIQRYFTCEDKGKHTVKGISDAIQVYRVVNENMARTRLDAQGETVEMTPLVGRDKEVNQLYALWEEAKSGNTHVVLLSGEPGLGKSRVVRRMVKHAAKEQDAWLVFHQCSPYHQQTAFYPIAQLISHIALEFKSDESNTDKIKRLEGFLLQFGMVLDEMLPLFAGIMSLSLEGSTYRPTPFSPEQQKQKLIGAFLNMYVLKSKDQTLMVVYEDLQWIDPSTLEVITQLIQQSAALRGLIVLSYRLEFTPPWRMQGHIVPMPLSNLSPQAIGQIVLKIAGGKTIPDEIIEQIILKTDGIPLFVEELTKMVMGSDILEEKEHSYVLNGPVSALAIPSTLHDSLEARLDRMSHTKQIAQMGAAIGRQFSRELIIATSLMEPNATSDCLNELVGAELLLQHGFPPDCTYKFRHALIQDAAYQSLLKSQRQQFHERIATSITQNLSEYASQKPEVVAYHYERAMQPEKSVKYWAAAGANVKKHLAYEEALNYVDRGLSHLDKIEQDDERGRCELDLLMTRAPLYVMMKGFQSKEAYDVSLRMKELAIKLDDKTGRFKALRGLVTYQIFVGQSALALEGAKEALRIAESLNITELKIEAYRLVGQSSIYTGDFVQSLEAFEKSIAYFESLDDQSMKRLIGTDPSVFSLIQSSHVCFYLGYPDQALERALRASKLADEINHPFTLSLSKFILAFVLGHLNENKHMLEVTRAGLELAIEFDISMFVTEIASLLGYAEAMTGEVDSGILRSRKAIETRLTHGLIGGLHMHMYFLSTLYLSQCRYEEGLAAVQDVIEMSQSEDQAFISEIFRFKAEFLHGLDPEMHKKEISDTLKKSLQIAEQQKVKSLILRTAMSKVRLSYNENEKSEALNILKKTYEWFTEGFETYDLVQARLILEKNNNPPNPSV